MRNYSQGRLQQHTRFLRRQFLQRDDLPFGKTLSQDAVLEAMTSLQVQWKDRIYAPLTTLWLFLGQVLSEDHSCRSAVARLITHRLSHGLRPCSTDTSAYCQARKRLPEQLFSKIARQTGQGLDQASKQEWLWKKRRVYIFDGSTVSMPDTPANQEAYPQPGTQKPGLGFPLARIAAIFSLSCGAVVDLGICRYAGKGQGELSIFRTLWDNFSPGDVVLADRLMCTWRELYSLKQRGVDSVSQLQAMRKADFRRGKRLGKGDHIVQWPRPFIKSLSWQEQKKMPEFLTVRECRVHIEQAGFRSKSIIVVTTILDPKVVTKEDLAALYRARWNAELDLRSLKRTLKMEVLRCKTAELVRKEIWTHILAYNLIRTIMAQSAHEHKIKPRTISFKGALRYVEEFQRLMDFQNGRGLKFQTQVIQQLLACIAQHRVDDRPDRSEPRLRKRRPKHYGYLRKPRNAYKKKYTVRT